MGEQTTPIPQRIAPAISNIYLSSAGTQQSAPLYLLITEVSEQHLTLLSQNLNETLSCSSNRFGQEIQKSLTKHKIQKNEKPNEKSTSHIAPYDIPKIHKTTSRNETNRESEPSIVKEPDKKIENYVHIPDRVVPPRAVAVLPKTLDIHRDCIYPQRAQPPRIRFGPVQGVIEKMLHADADKLVVEAAVKEKPLFLFKRDEESVTHINVDDKDRSNWLSLLPLGKTSTANVWLYEEDSKLYGITTKLIPARTPLALGYSKTYADEHKIPPGQPVLDLEEALAERPSGWCHECKRSLGSATLLLRHMKFYHKGKRNSHKKYRCSYCSRTFRRSFTSPISEEHEQIEELEPSGSQSIEETKSPSDESFQNYTNALDFSTNLFDPDRISNIDMSESQKSEDELNTYPTDPTGLKLDNLDNIEDYSKFCKGLKFENSDEQKAKIEELNIACPHCEQRLTKSKKRRHIRERLKCECGKIFRRNVDFAKHVHMRHNTGLSNAQIKHDPDQKTSYTCENCNVRFKRRGMLVNHLWRVHNTTSAAVPLERRVRHYPCSVCPKIYRTAAKRDRHVIIHHPGSSVRAAPIEGQRLLSEPARCSACPREYATRSKLLQHIRAQHPEIVVSTKSDSKSRPLVTITTLGDSVQCMSCLKMEYGVEEGIPSDLFEYEFIAQDALEFELQLAEARDVKFTQQLSEPLAIGSHIVCTGTPCEDIPWFAINIGCDEEITQKEVAVHFNVRMPQVYVVRNTRRHSKWGPEETTAFRLFPFKQGQLFTIEILVDEKATLWAIDGEFYCSYTHRLPSPFTASWVQVVGVKDATLTIKKTDIFPTLAPPSQEVPLRTSVDIPAENEPSWRPHVIAKLSDGLPEGHQIVVHGRLRSMLHSFAIDLMDCAREWPLPNIHAHVNVRAYDEAQRDRQLVVLNAWLGCWGPERRQRTAKLIPGTQTTIRIIRGVGEWSVYTDDILIGELEYRASAEGVKAVRLRGDLYPEQIYICPYTSSPVREDA